MGVSFNWRILNIQSWAEGLKSRLYLKKYYNSILKTNNPVKR